MWLVHVCVQEKTYRLTPLMAVSMGPPNEVVLSIAQALVSKARTLGMSKFVLDDVILVKNSCRLPRCMHVKLQECLMSKASRTL